MYIYITVYSCTYIWNPGYSVLKLRTQYIYYIYICSKPEQIVLISYKSKVKISMWRSTIT